MKVDNREHVKKALEEAIPFIDSRGYGGVAHLMYDALELLKEQEGVVPYIDIDEAKCPVCKVKLTRQELIGDDVLFEDFFDYCPHCGKPVLWEGW